VLVRPHSSTTPGLSKETQATKPINGRPNVEVFNRNAILRVVVYSLRLFPSNDAEPGIVAAPHHFIASTL
jgi:hypothetical protein